MLTFAQTEAADAAMIYAGEMSEPVSFFNGTEMASAPGIVDLTVIEVDLDSGAQVMSEKPRVSLWGPMVPWPLMADAGQIAVVRGLRYTIRHVDVQGDLTAAGSSPGSVVVHLNRAKS